MNSSAPCELSPYSGSEPARNDNLWNKMKYLKGSHNCMMYGLNSVDKSLIKKCKETPDCNVGFPQPGYASGADPFNDKTEKGCLDLVARLWGDNPNDVKSTTFDAQCGQGTSKIAVILGKKDYHFLRQDKEDPNSNQIAKWSHKPGAMSVTDKDSSARPIIRPDRATFMYSKYKDPLHYTEFCGYYCVPRNKRLHLTNYPRRGGAGPSSLLARKHRTRRLRARGVSRSSRR